MASVRPPSPEGSAESMRSTRDQQTAKYGNHAKGLMPSLRDEGANCFRARFRDSLRPGGIASRMASILARQNSLRLDGDSPIPLPPFLCRALQWPARQPFSQAEEPVPGLYSQPLPRMAREWQGNRLWNQGSDFGFGLRISFGFQNSDFGFEMGLSITSDSALP